MSYSLNNKEYTTDDKGFLLDLNEWSEELAQVIAHTLDITLTEQHWAILNLLRNVYMQYDLAPANRALVKLAKERLGADFGQSIYLMQLFGGSPARDAAKIAGLPKPPHCL